MMRSVAVDPRSEVSLERYASTTGRSDALIEVVLARSYSRNSGRSSLLSVTTNPALRQRSPTSCS
jgi:hypothetical protein